jgi:tetratricopeptide (TPR) repeat protein
VKAPFLIGRDEELRVLTEAIARAPHRGSAVLVTGDAGIGKSMLLAAAADEARRHGFRVLTTTGVESETLIPFAGVHQLLRPLLTHAEILPDGQRQALDAAFGATSGTAPELFMIALATLNLLTEAAAATPVVVVIDDIQWLDDATRETLAFVARRLDSDPVVLIGALRGDQFGPLAHAAATTVEVRGLSDRSARELLDVSDVALTRDQRDRILREALGNPLALVELPVARRATGHPSAEPEPDFLPLSSRLERVFTGRLVELPDDTRAVMLVAAVDSLDELPEILAAASVFAGRPLGVDALEAAEAAGLLRFDERRVAFRHPLVRSGVLQAESVARRQAAHAALAEVLTADPYRLAWHRAHAIVGPDDEVADALEANHAVALNRGAIEAAIQALERSADLTTDPAARGRRLLLAAFHAYELGRANLVERLVQSALMRSLSELDRVRAVWLRELFSDGTPGDAARVLNLCDDALRADCAGDRDLAVKLLYGAALRCWWADSGAAAQGHVAATLAELHGFEADPRGVATLAVAEPLRQGRLVGALLAGTVLEEVTDADALRLYGQAAHAIGDQVRAADFLDRAETKLRGEGRLGLIAIVLGAQAVVLLDLGDWQRAMAACEEGRHIATETGQTI